MIIETFSACAERNNQSMIITKTPHRISFFGGGTDYPSWYLKYGGKVLGAAIDKYCYLTCRYLPPFFEHRYRVVYSKIETVRRSDEIAHPSVELQIGPHTDVI